MRLVPTYAVYCSNDLCTHLADNRLEGMPLRLLSGGWNQDTSYHRFRFGPGARLLLLGAEQRILYAVAAMTVTAKPTRAEWLAEHPNDAPLCQGEQLVVGENGTPIRFDTGLAPAVLERMRFVSGKSERPLKPVVGGLLMRTTSLQVGVSCLTAESTELIERGLAGADHDPGELAELHRTLSEQPRDREAAQVLCDAWLERGDRRGEALRIELEQLKATDKQQRTLNNRLFKLATTHPRELLGRPGGFPYRTSWAPRRVLSPAR